MSDQMGMHDSSWRQTMHRPITNKLMVFFFAIFQKKNNNALPAVLLQNNDKRSIHFIFYNHPKLNLLFGSSSMLPCNGAIRKTQNIVIVMSTSHWSCELEIQFWFIYFTNWMWFQCIFCRYMSTLQPLATVEVQIWTFLALSLLFYSFLIQMRMIWSQTWTWNALHSFFLDFQTTERDKQPNEKTIKDITHWPAQIQDSNKTSGPMTKRDNCMRTAVEKSCVKDRKK